ncbi:sine oculis-binding protein homolog B [Wyeomyia smithii]|uniref:sine oculis-binding protein homolog B n=1 Tax=Wyeomyia smithii TaxID=174621 RepID=UPI002467AE6E|nr:sine oculis-binding protein homolog B [Wyeomyia smithii]
MDLVMAAPAKSSSPHRVKVKKELCSEPDNIKDFAETAMNDILGWYGYGDSVDRIDITLPTSATPTPTGGGESNRCNSTGSSSNYNKDNNNGTSKGSSTLKSKHSKAQQQQQHKSRQFNIRRQQHNSSELRDTIASVAAVVTSGVASPASPSSSLGKAAATGGTAGGGGGGNNTIASTNNSNDSRGSCSNNNNNNNTRNGVNLHHHGESSTSEKDSSRESSKSPMLVKMLDKQEPVCQWCCRGVPPNQTGILGTTEGTIFCSESCFSQSRRASFKRAKTCDWCRHVRHAVSYVDFQDGVTQLQFCSDKCLNQYKMQIFCNETQAHLDMNPHLKEKSTATGGNLITPDLWLKNCKSRSASPATDRSESTSPTPSLPMRPSPEPSPVMQSPPAKKPLISVAPVSKLLSKNLQVTITRSPVKTTRKRRTALRPIQQTVLGSRRVASGKGDFSQINHNNNNNSNVLNNNLTVNSATIMSKPATATSSNVQDLRSSISIPQLSHPKKFENLEPSSNPRPTLNLPPPYMQLPPTAAPMRHPFFPMNPAFRFGTPPPQSPMPPPPPVGNLPPNIDNSNRPPASILGLPAPPVTILVPYPIVIPLPLPIPIPIPLVDFLKATSSEQSAESTKVEPAKSVSPLSNTEQSTSRTDGRTVMSEAELEEDAAQDDSPLDFTTVSHEQRLQREATVILPFEQSAEPESYTLEAVSHDEQTVDDGDKIPEQKLPKFKITRLSSKCAESDEVTGEQSSERLGSAEKKRQEDREEEESRDMVERSRPLRKRKRLAMVVHHEQVEGKLLRESDSGDGKG